MENKTFVHGEEGTHYACDARIKEMGGKAQCCGCFPHNGCGEGTQNKKECLCGCVGCEGKNCHPHFFMGDAFKCFCPCHQKPAEENKRINNMEENYKYISFTKEIIIDKILLELEKLL